ncbi:MAG: hypothetical protein KKE24_06250 [Candidatus Thermoplasmatota archaeon]|nr:hypothetical protein [Candidatus Thermoplasmatota archaeon]
MEKKILTIMVVLVVAATLMVAVVLIAAGGMRSAGGFTKLFDDLENPTSSVTYNQYLEMPDGWELGDTMSVNDRIVDMYLIDTDVISSSITIYDTVLYFMYMSDKWTDTDQGTSFYVPCVGAHNGYIHVSHGLFSLTVSSATNLSAEYDIGDIIGLETKLVINNDVLSFDEWSISD